MVGPGSTLSHFRILAKIGEGGMGVVYRAEDQKLRRHVALKVLPPELVGNEERRLRFLREARSAAAVNHPNIATIYEVDEADGVVFIAMELVEGKTLRDVIAGRLMPIKDALRIATEMAEGLAKAHQAGVIHRDFKPDNVIVDSDGHAKILDFGLAKLIEEHGDLSSEELSKLETISGDITRAGRVLGTAAYMSPEQARGDRVDARSDLFSFGTTLYEMVTSKAPFRGRTSTDTLSAIIRDDPDPPSHENADVSAELERIIFKCLEKDPADRYQDTRDAAIDLRKLKHWTDSGLQAARTPTGPLGGVLSSGWARLVRSRHRRLAVVVGLGILLIVVGAGLWWGIGSQAGFQEGDRVLVAGFENRTARAEFTTAIRDSFESMLGASTYLEVVRGKRLEELIQTYSAGSVVGMGRELADRICREGNCEGFLIGKIESQGEGYKVEASLFRAEQRQASATLTMTAPSEKDLLLAMHRNVLDLRRSIGEVPQSVSLTDPPETRSILAFQAMVATSRAETNDETAALARRALELDPEFADAYWLLGAALYNIGDLRGYRGAMEEAYRRSHSLAVQTRLRIESSYFGASYQFDKELERLKAFQRLYPHVAETFHDLGSLYRGVYQDRDKATEAFEEAYRLAPTRMHLKEICSMLVAQERPEEIERRVAEYQTEHGPDPSVGEFLLWASIIRGDVGEIHERIERLQETAPGLREDIELASLQWLMASGRLAEARRRIKAPWGAPEQEVSIWYKLRAGHFEAWLDERQGSKPVNLSSEVLKRAEEDLRHLPGVAALCVDMRLADPLPPLIEMHERFEKGSESRFVREELQFARGCLALIEGEAGKARQILEPLTYRSRLVRRHQMLGRVYEALQMWQEAAEQYEQVLSDSHRWDFFEIPAVPVLNQYRLAQVYERLDNPDRALHWYERFLTDWKDADPDIPELIEAKKRMAALGEVEKAVVR